MAPEATVGGLRLAPQQRRAWTVGARHGGARGPSVAVRLEGAPSEAALRQAVDTLVARHEILRSTLVSVPGLKVPLQRVEAHAPEGDTNLRATVSTGDDGSAVLHLALPATHGDLRSLAVLAEELADLLAGRELPDEVFQYGQYSEYANELLDDASDDGEEHWRGVGAPRSVVEGAAGAVARQERVEVEAGELPRASRESWLALWVAFLGRTLAAGRPSVLVGVSVDGRDFEVLERAVGRFERLLPVRLETGAGATLDTLARRAEAALEDAVEWADELDLDAWLGSPGAAVDFHLAHRSGWPGLLAARSVAEPGLLGLEVTDGPDGISLALVFDPDRLEPSAADALGAAFGTFAAAALAAPETAVDRLPLLDGPAARETVERHLGEAATGEVETVLERFAAAARRHPERPAVVAGERVLSHRELAARAAALSAELRAAGVGPEVPVGLLFDRSAEMVVALLGVLGAGGAYVPLDPTLPTARVAGMIEQLGLSLVLEGPVSDGVPPVSGPERRPVDLDSPTPADAPATWPPSVAPESLAYVLFTSGSTGAPKGVAVEHRQLGRYAQAVLDRLDLPDDAFFGMVSGFAADLGNTVLFGALASGGTLVAATADEAFAPEAYARLVERWPLDVVKIVPSHLRGLLAASSGDLPLPRRALVSGGEALDRDLAGEILRRAPEAALWNHYGPTETTVGVVAGEVTAGHLESGAPPPLGRALAGQRPYVLDAHLQPVPDGVAGELWLAGDGVTRGYVGRPGATAERFVPDPWATTPGERMYRTGDRARWSGDGELEFLGRVDHQVKVRGYRVELGEVEAVLLAAPEVEQAAVVAVPASAGATTAPGDSLQLVGYVAGRRGARLEPGELRVHLRRHLPEHMVPSTLAVLPTLPLAAHGKVDRSALPDPSTVEETSRRPHVAPSSPLEEVLAEIWGDVLGIDDLSVADDLFELGGHSLLAMQVLARIQETLRVELPLRAVFQASTVEALARTLVEHDSQPGRVEKIAAAVQKVRALSADQVRGEIDQRRGDRAEGSP